jgi:hypothetical protein
MDVLFPDMDYNKTGSGSSVYANANRVSRDEEHIAVLVPHSALHETPYGFCGTTGRRACAVRKDVAVNFAGLAVSRDSRNKCVPKQKKLES